jgi:hypothetical protein
MPSKPGISKVFQPENYSIYLLLLSTFAMQSLMIFESYEPNPPA